MKRKVVNIYLVICAHEIVAMLSSTNMNKDSNTMGASERYQRPDETTVEETK